MRSGRATTGTVSSAVSTPPCASCAVRSVTMRASRGSSRRCAPAAIAGSVRRRVNCCLRRPWRFRPASPATSTRIRQQWKRRARRALGTLANTRRDYCRRAGRHARLRAAAGGDCPIMDHDRNERRRRKHRRQQRRALACGQLRIALDGDAARSNGEPVRVALAIRGGEVVSADVSGRGATEQMSINDTSFGRERLCSRRCARAAARRCIEAAECGLAGARGTRVRRRRYAARRCGERRNDRARGQTARKHAQRRARSQWRAARLRALTAHAGSARARSGIGTRSPLWRAMRCAALSWPIRVRQAGCRGCRASLVLGRVGMRRRRRNGTRWRGARRPRRRDTCAISPGLRWPTTASTMRWWR